MAGDLLIIKKRGHKITMKVTKAVKNGYAPDHKIAINLGDYKDVALLLHDLKDLYNVNLFDVLYM